MSCGPCFKLHPAIHLLNDCYPPTKQLESGKEPKPLQDELAKFLYHARNRPNQLPQIGKELERRITKEASSSTAGYAKYRLLLFVSLRILKRLLVECNRDLSGFIRPSLNAIAKALETKVYQQGTPDGPIVERACSCFASLATYAEAAPFADPSLNGVYYNILRRLSVLCDSDEEGVPAAALVGLGGAAKSHALTWSDVEAERQMAVVLPPLLQVLWPAPELLDSAATLQDSEDYFHQQAERPAYTRRAPSVAEKSEVVPIAMRALKALLEQCRVNQITTAVDVLLQFLDRHWGDGKCNTFGRLFIAFAPLEFQHLVPTRLLSAASMSSNQARHTGLLEMLHSALQVRCVGLNVTTVLQGLLQILPRRLRVSDRDPLLPLLVQCISALATQIYYPDQISDMVEELAVQTTDKEEMRIRVWCIIRTLQVAHNGDAAIETNGKGKANGVVNLRRNPVSYEVWGDTLSILCDESYLVRAAYVRALLLYIDTEMSVLLQREAGLDFVNLVYSSIYVLAFSRLGENSAFDDVATPFDFGNIIEIIRRLNQVAPAASLLRGGPVLLAMDRHAGEQLHGTELYVMERKRAIRETVTWAWDILARHWHVEEVMALCKKTIASLPEPLIVPDFPLGMPSDVLPLPDEKARFVEYEAEGETSATARPLLNPNVIIPAFSNVRAGNVAAALKTQWTLDHTWDQEIRLDDPVSAILLGDNSPETPSQLLNVNDLRTAAERTTLRTKRQPNKVVLKEIFRD